MHKNPKIMPVLLPSKTKPHRGFSLLEVLIALLVLSIGLLGLAALQTMGLKFNQQSYQRTQATLLSYEILDRIRANPVGKANAKFDNVALGAIPAHNNCLTIPLCDANAMADYDIFQWNTALASQLTEGRGVICKGTLTIDTAALPATAACAVTGTIFRVGVVWSESDLRKNMIVESQL